MIVYGIFLWCVYKYTGVHAFVSPYIEPLLENYVLPVVMPLIERHIIQNYMFLRDHPASKPYLCYIASITEKIQQFYHICQPTMKTIQDASEIYLTLWYHYLYTRGIILYTILKIKYIEWLGVCGIEDSNTLGVYWVKYTSMGQTYKIPVRMARTRGPSKRDEELDKIFGLAVSGAHGDYHGQQELLRSMVINEQILDARPVVNTSLDELMRTPLGEKTGSLFSTTVDENKH
uniref:Uncharacterized protein n=1 Tax=viral metagenome TaxID=1070528 RepID=A0A6C0JTM7_9ZZZZ